MVALVYSCPHCQQAEPVVRFGRNRSGTPRLWCKDCRKSFTPHPKERRLTQEKQEKIQDALGERLSQRAIARMLNLSRDTIRKTLKKRPTQPI